MKQYHKPEMVIIEIQSEEVIATSLSVNSKETTSMLKPGIRNNDIWEER